MFNVNFYEDVHKCSQVRNFIAKLNQSAEGSKQDKNKLEKIYKYIEFLERSGTREGMPITEHIDGKIWQTRPGKIRILFFVWNNNEIILLHAFEKKTKKTPKREIDRAKNEMNDWISRYGH